ncbi:MAG: branched-chain amino acid ABC transporter permease [Desulfuromusa sp.]|nr:branched-chain amino acid ABC transporter permease [Desulfuromusa sp.]
MIDLVQPIINGILLGGLYALVAVGMSMMFGIVRLVNLAHGDLMILSAYLAFVLTSSMGIHPLLTLILVIPAMFVIGYCVQKYLLNRVLGNDMEPPLLVAFGISIIAQNLMILVFSPDAQSLNSSLAIASVTLPMGISVSVLYVIGFVASIVVVFLLQMFFKHSYMGRAIRAASDDEMAAQLNGVFTKRTYATAMGIAMMTASIAGVLIGMMFTFYPYTGSQYMLIAFGVVVIGGLGSIKGVFAGGIILALAQLLGAHFFGPGYQLLCGYLVLLVVLAVRPQGIFGTV